MLSPALTPAFGWVDPGTHYGRRVFALAVLIPSPPILVPELCGAGLRAPSGADNSAAAQAMLRDAQQVAQLRAAVLAAGQELAAASSQWTVIGVDGTAADLSPEGVGTFRGFGADVVVGLSAAALADTSRADAELGLPALLAGWLRGVTAPTATISGQVIAADTTPARCADIGARVRTRLASAATAQAVLVVADGATTVTRRAPGYYDPRAQARQDAVDQALAAGDRTALASLPVTECAELGMTGRAAYQVLAGLFAADPMPPAVRTSYQGAPFGVGYQVSVWRPGGNP